MLECTYVRHMNVPGKEVVALGTAVKGVCELPCVVAGNKARVL